MNVLVQHIPHAVPVVVIWGLLIRFWLAQRRLDRDEAAAAVSSPVATPAAALVARPAVRRSVAVRGLLALGPLIGALATGLVIYAVNLGRGHAAQAAIWTHVGLSLLALLLVAYKMADIGWAGLRQSVTRRRAVRSGPSIVLLVLWAPLLVSGVALLIWPSQASFTAYAHLIASVWWTGLLLWHLRRYLLRATRAALARPGQPSGGIAPARSTLGCPVRAQPAAPHQSTVGQIHPSASHGSTTAAAEPPGAQRSRRPPPASAASRRRIS